MLMLIYTISKYIVISIFSTGIILILGDQCPWIVKILIVRGDGISWETGRDVNSWVRETHEIHDQ